MKIIFSIILVLLGCNSPIKLGIDGLESMDYSILHNKNVAMVVNHTSINSKGIHLIDLLTSQPNISVKKVFTPEHGISGRKSAGEYIGDGKNKKYDIPIISLYGKNKTPSSSDLLDVEVIIFDLQDIGSRYYTYVSTMVNVMESAAENGIKFLVLNRPNPLGKLVEGPIGDIRSFVGKLPIPIRHGLTVGEIAKMIVNKKWLNTKHPLDLHVIELENWNSEAGYFSIPPSPNIPDFETALIYNGLCLLEGTNISEGRGTDKPFRLFGAPWINGDEITDKLNSINLHGVRFESVNFTPQKSMKAKWPKYENEICNGAKIIILDKKNLSPLTIGVEIIRSIYELYPQKFKFLESNFIDKLYGSNQLRIQVISKASIEEIKESWVYSY
jgi:uncharacterized protein YbbC (DUF1343 family)